MRLTREQLCELSGRKQRSAVIRWLGSQGMPFVLDADGWPVVAEAVMLARLGGKVQTLRDPPKVRHLRHA